MKFRLVYADPPWSYENEKTGGSLASGASAAYPTMTIEDIKSLPVERIVHDNAILALWATNPLLPEAFEVIKAWGFTYKTDWPWKKEGRLGLGFWSRCDVEHLLIGVRGHVPPPRLGTPSILCAPVGVHSRKPAEMRARVEQMARVCFSAEPGSLFTDLPTAPTISEIRAIELFARQTFDGWTCLGNDIDGQDIRNSMKKFSCI